MTFALPDIIVYNVSAMVHCSNFDNLFKMGTWNFSVNTEKRLNGQNYFCSKMLHWPMNLILENLRLYIIFTKTRIFFSKCMNVFDWFELQKNVENKHMDSKVYKQSFKEDNNYTDVLIHKSLEKHQWMINSLLFWLTIFSKIAFISIYKVKNQGHNLIFSPKFWDIYMYRNHAVWLSKCSSTFLVRTSPLKPLKEIGWYCIGRLAVICKCA